MFMFNLNEPIKVAQFQKLTPRRGRDVPQRRYWVFNLELTGDVVATY